MPITGGDCRNGVTVVQYLVASEDIHRDVARVDRTFPNLLGFARHLRQIRARDYGKHSGKIQCLGGIDLFYPRMSMGASQYFAVEHSREGIVGAIFGPAGYLVRAVMADRPGANYPEARG